MKDLSHTKAYVKGTKMILVMQLRKSNDPGNSGKIGVYVCTLYEKIVSSILLTYIKLNILFASTLELTVLLITKLVNSYNLKTTFNSMIENGIPSK